MKTTGQILRKARKRGWPDSALAKLGKVSEETIRRARIGEGNPPREMAWNSMWPIYETVIVNGTMYDA